MINCLTLYMKYPVLRKNPFSLKDLAGVAVCDSTTFDDVLNLEIPDILKNLLRTEYSTASIDMFALFDCLRIDELDNVAIIYVL